MGAFLYIGVIAGAGFIYYWFRKRGRINVIEGSRAAVPDPEQPAAP